MRRCPRCTSLTEDGPCSTCRHVPYTAAGTGHVSLARRYTPGSRPAGVAFLSFLGMAAGAWVIVSAGMALVAALAAAQEIEDISPEVARKARSSFTLIALLAMLVGLLVIVVNVAFRRGAEWAWWVVLLVDAMWATDASMDLLKVRLLPRLFQPFSTELTWLLAAFLTFYLGCVAYLLTPVVRRYVFGGPRRVAA